MPAEQFNFAYLMARADRVAVALDGLSSLDGPRATAAAVNAGRRLCTDLLDYRRSVIMTQQESVALENALDALRARLNFFGQRN
jgi:hypothetical protein